MKQQARAENEATDRSVLIHHSVSAVFDTRFQRRLKSRLVTSGLSDASVEVATTTDESVEKLDTAEVVLTMRSVADDISPESEVQWVQTLNAGVDLYDLDRLEELGIVVTNASGVAANPIAEQVLGYMLVFERQIETAIRQQERRGVWRNLTGGELASKTVGIVGVGAIGSRVAELASAFDMAVIGTKRTPETAPDVVDDIYPPSELSEVLTRSEFVVLACPLVEATRGLIGPEELVEMQSDAVLINIARGEVVDEPALETALQKDRIRGAALDVFETEPLPPDSVLWDLSNVVITPHMAGSTPKYIDRVTELFEDNYDRYADGDLDGLSNRII